jgi:hypothetical protein
MGRHSQDDNGVPERREQMADTYNGYCVKCREKRDFEGEVKELANGSKAAQGQCPVCGTKMTRMLPKSAKVES